MIAHPSMFEVVAEPGTEAAPRGAPAQPAHDENLYLLGRPTLRRYIQFVRSHAVAPPDKGTLTEEWEAAREHIRQLEIEEAGLADGPAIQKLDARFEPSLIEFLKDPLVRNGFNTVPTEVAIVELDRMVVYQKHIDVTFTRQLQEKIGPSPTDEALFRFCLPYDHPHPPVKWSRVHGDSFVFVSPSNDLRFLGALPLQANHISHYPPPGSLVGVVGLAVGFGSNFMNAICTENRLILNNGSHRAYTLRSLGITHAPCIVQHVSSRDALNVVAATNVVKDPDAFLQGPRPSMLRDYFNPRLHKVIPSRRSLRQIILKYEVEEMYVPAL